MLLAVAILLAALSAGAAAGSSTPEEATVSFPEPAESSAIQLMPRDDLERAEASQLLQAVFSEPLNAPSAFYESFDVEQFHTDHVAVAKVEQPDGEKGPTVLLESLLPLRDTDGGVKARRLDFNLVRTDGGNLEPVNPLVDLSIPSEIGEGIGILDAGIEVHLLGAPDDRTASVVDGNVAFYPNVAEDSDFSAVATPTGLETFTVLRTPEAPRSQIYRIDLPLGAKINALPDGGAEISRDGATLATIPPPTAVDAVGEPVQVEMAVEGDRLILQSKPSSSAQYPILVDPIFEKFQWQPGNSNGLDRFTGYVNSNLFAYSYSGPNGEPGLSVNSVAGSVASGAEAGFRYRVPRYAQDLKDFGVPPTSFIYSMNLYGVNWYINDTAPLPVVRTGLKEVNNNWVSMGQRQGGEGPMSGASIYHINPAWNVGVKEGIISLANDGSTVSRARWLYVGNFTVELMDADSPIVGFAHNPLKWQNGLAGSAQAPLESIPFSAEDGGFGIHRVSAKIPAAAGGSIEAKKMLNCWGTFDGVCPRIWESSFGEYDPKEMPQGENVLRLTAGDPIGHASPEKLVKVNVDKTPPAVELSGSLLEQATVGTLLAQYGVTYNASDGDEVAAAAGTPFGSAGTGAGQLERPMGVATDSGGNVFVVDRLNNRVVKFDSTGKFLTQWGSTGSANGQFNDPRGITVSPNGMVSVVDQGNDRIQTFTSEGAFIRKTTFVDPASQPYAIASGPGGVLWVTDVGLHRVLKLSEGGTLLATASGRQADPASSATDLDAPSGVATDAFGNVWVTDAATHRVIEFSSAGKWLFQFGASGTGNGQLSQPVGIDVAPSGNIAVVDRGNGRVQVFKPDGTYLRQFGTSGTGNAQLSEAVGLAFGPGNAVTIADAGNKRIARWTHADHDPQSGAAKVEIKVDGTTVKTVSPGCATKNCAITGSWTLKADDYPVGQHKVEVIATDAVGIPTTKVLNVETHGDLQAPAIALSGSMTQQASLGTTRPAYTLKAAATDPGSAEERKSGVASVTIKVDGKVVDSSAPGCSAGGCAITREWTLNALNYAVGSHSVEVVATDGAGRSTTKTLGIEIARDTTVPEFTGLASFYTAPEGWVEQKGYGFAATATDVNGFGVTNLQLKIDGVVVKAASGTCSSGGCSKTIGFAETIDMSKYDGGAHPAELIATDGAGNSRKRNWTINVDPKGTITVGEATDTMEAVEETAPEGTELTPVHGLVTEAIGEDGLDIELVSEAGQLVSSGAPAPSTVSLDPASGFSVQTKGLSEEEVMHDALVEVTPVQVGPNASDAQPVTDSSAAVISNSAPGADTVIRPAYNGLMSFQAIRDATAPGTYSWEVNLGPGESLVSIDAKNAAVVWDDGTQALLIAAQAAHGADGSAVATTLAVSQGNVITLTVHHQAAGVVYPVVAGVGWQGGYQFHQAVFNNPSPPEEESEKMYSDGVMGSPVPYIMQNDDPGGGASSSGVTYKYLKTFRFRQCSLDWSEQYRCKDWMQALKGFFWYNYKWAWYPDRDPVCENSGSLGITVSYQECEWVGVKKAWYETPGDHITARVLYKIHYVIKGTIDEDRHMSVYAYPSGYANEHDTACICNPST